MKWNKIIIGLALGCIWQHGMAQLFSIQGNLQHVPDDVVLELLANKPFGYEVVAKDSLKDASNACPSQMDGRTNEARRRNYKDMERLSHK